MKIEVKAPLFPESIESGWLSKIHVAPGQMIARDELLFDIETEKVILEVVAPSDGKMIEYSVKVGETVNSEQIIGMFEECDIPNKPENSGSEVLVKEKTVIQTRVEPQNTHTSHAKIIGVLCFIAGTFFGALIAVLASSK